MGCTASGESAGKDRDSDTAVIGSVKRDIKSLIYSYAPPPAPTTRKSPSFCFGFRPIFNTNCCSTHFSTSNQTWISELRDGPSPTEREQSFRERRGAALARRRLVFPLFCFGRDTHTAPKTRHTLFRAYKGKRALASLAASQHFLPELLTIT